MSTGLALFTLAHVIISIVGIVTGLIAVIGWMMAKRFPTSTGIFLATTAATSITGFFFPFHGFKPSYVVGIISLVILAVAYKARSHYEKNGTWRAAFVSTSVIALYLNVFVLIVQSFMKVPALHALAPTQTEGPFKMTQLATLIAFIVIGIVAAKKYPRRS